MGDPNGQAPQTEPVHAKLPDPVAMCIDEGCLVLPEFVPTHQAWHTDLEARLAAAAALAARVKALEDKLAALERKVAFRL